MRTQPCSSWSMVSVIIKLISNSWFAYHHNYFHYLYENHDKTKSTNYEKTQTQLCRINVVFTATRRAAIATVSTENHVEIEPHRSTRCLFTSKTNLRRQTRSDTAFLFRLHIRSHIAQRDHTCCAFLMLSHTATRMHLSFFGIFGPMSVPPSRWWVLKCTGWDRLRNAFKRSPAPLWPPHGPRPRQTRNWSGRRWI